jgi:hypothetical protein
MNRKKLARLRSEVEVLRRRRNNLRSSDLTRLALKVERKPNTSRGKEPTYESVIPGLRPLTIPGHKKINPFTGLSILQALEKDLDTWEILLDQMEKKENENRKRLPSRTVREDRDSS